MDRDKLYSNVTQKQFHLELDNRFSVLEDAAEDDVDKAWITWRDLMNQTKYMLGLFASAVSMTKFYVCTKHK